MKIVFKYLKPYIAPILFSIVFLVGQVFTELSLPNLMSSIVDDGILAGGNMEVIMKIGIEMILMTILSAACAVGVSFISSRVAAAVARNLRRDIFEKVNSFSSAEINNFSTASLITRSTNDVQQIQMLVTMGLKIMLFAPLMGVGSIVMALSKSKGLAWIIILALVVIIGLLLVLLVVAMPKFKIMQKLVDKVNLVSREQLSGLMVIRAFSNEKHEEERFDAANTELTVTNRFTHRLMSFMMPSVQLVMSFVSIAIVWFGAKAIDLGTLEIGDMLAFLQYATHILISFVFVSVIFVMVPRAAVSAARINEVLNTELEVYDNPDAKGVQEATGNIEFCNVSFKYPGAKNYILENISFTAKPGETTAIIGATGSGKSTLVNLIPRFFNATDGSVLLDGENINNIKVHDLRNAIGYVPQKAILFSGTVESNIKYGNDVEDVSSAIETAQAKEFVDSLEDGIQSSIAQGATNVSGGQKQRLAIARALAKDAPVYIFDDSFSALDFRTDAALRAALASRTKKATLIIVAQRVSTVMKAEQIIVLENGRMVGCGSHADLLNSCPQYKEICESQLSKEELL